MPWNAFWIKTIICVVMLADEQDTQDVIQDTFCAYLEKQPQFADREHEKAWLIRVAVNRCKDILRFRKRHPSISEEELRGRGMDLPADGESRQVLEALWELPARQRAVIYLYYVEGYRVREIAEMLRISEQAVKKRMQRGREQLRMTLKEEWE